MKHLSIVPLLVLFLVACAPTVEVSQRGDGSDGANVNTATPNPSDGSGGAYTSTTGSGGAPTVDGSGGSAVDGAGGDEPIAPLAFQWARAFVGSDASNTFTAGDIGADGSVYLAGLADPSVSFDGDAPAVDALYHHSHGVRLRLGGNTGAVQWARGFSFASYHEPSSVIATVDGACFAGNYRWEYLFGPSDRNGFARCFYANAKAAAPPTYAAGSGDQNVSTFALMPDGGIVLAGTFDGAFTNPPGFVGEPGGSGFPRVYVERIDASGAVQWAVQSTGEITKYGAPHVALATSGDVIIVGHYSGDFALDGAAPLPSTNASAGYVARLDASTGAVKWIRSFKGAEDATVAPLSVSMGAGGIAVSGMFNGSADIAGASITTNAFSSAFVARLDASTGAVQWARTIEGARGAVVADSAAGLFVASTAEQGARLALLDSSGGEVASRVIVGAVDVSTIAARAGRVIIAGSASGAVEMGGGSVDVPGHGLIVGAYGY